MLKRLTFTAVFVGSSRLAWTLAWTLAWAPLARAWGELGHATVGEIAQHRVRPSTIRAIEEILGPEILATAALWPDLARSDPRFDAFRPYHYVTATDTKGYVPAPRDALTLLKKFPGIVRDATLSRDQRAVALRYIVHVVGDLHQPLHVGRSDDRGGTLCRVQWKGRPLNLHSLWDDAILEAFRSREAQASESYFGATKFADLLLGTPQDLLSGEGGHNAPLEDWLTEAIALRPHVYPKDRVPYCDRGGRHRAMISDAYADEALAIMRRQILRGGFRLAALLDKIFEDHKEARPLDFGFQRLLEIAPR